MTARVTMLLAAAIAAGAFAVGCGGGGEDTVTASSLSKAAFIKQATAICARGREKSQSYKAPAGTNEEEAFDQSVDAAVVPAYKEVVDEIRSLGAPQGDEAQIEAYLRSMQRGIEELEERSAPITSFEQLEAPFEPSGAMARRYGMAECGFGI